jgi:hypothetical protein
MGSEVGLVASITYPLSHDAIAKCPAEHRVTALGRVVTTPQAPQLLALVVRSVSQPSEGSLLQSPHLQEAARAVYPLQACNTTNSIQRILLSMHSTPPWQLLGAQSMHEACDSGIPVADGIKAV